MTFIKKYSKRTSYDVPNFWYRKATVRHLEKILLQRHRYIICIHNGQFLTLCKYAGLMHFFVQVSRSQPTEEDSRRKSSPIPMSFRITKQSVRWNSRLFQHTLPPSSETMATIDLIRYQRHCFLGNSKPPYHPYLQNVQKCFK